MRAPASSRAAAVSSGSSSWSAATCRVRLQARGQQPDRARRPPGLADQHPGPRSWGWPRPSTPGPPPRAHRPEPQSRPPAPPPGCGDGRGRRALPVSPPRRETTPSHPPAASAERPPTSRASAPVTASCTCWCPLPHPGRARRLSRGHGQLRPDHVGTRGDRRGRRLAEGVSRVAECPRRRESGRHPANLERASRLPRPDWLTRRQLGGGHQNRPQGTVLGGDGGAVAAGQGRGENRAGERRPEEGERPGAAAHAARAYRGSASGSSRAATQPPPVRQRAKRPWWAEATSEITEVPCP